MATLKKYPKQGIFSLKIEIILFLAVIPYTHETIGHKKTLKLEGFFMCIINLFFWF